MMRIFVKAKPASKKEQVEKIDDAHFKVSVKEPPLRGRANEAIARALAEHFNISGAGVKMVSGFASKNKIFDIYR